MFHGLISFSFWGYVAVTLLMTHVTVLAVTIYLHRCQAHRALDLHPALSHFFRFWLWLTTSMSTRGWVSVHRKHHTFVETEDDPHSPVVLGLARVFFGGVILYHRESKNPETLERFGRGCPNDWLERRVYGPYGRLGPTALLIIELLLVGWPALIVWGIQMIWIPLWASGFINGIGHAWGYRNFGSPDASTNIIPWGIIAGGEELHNNHHAFGTSAKLSVKWWEFDIGWAYIRLFEMLGLAKVHRSIPKIIKDLKKTAVDDDTLGALLGNRFQVLDQYWRSVVRPVLREQKQHASEPQLTLLRRAPKLLTKDESLINAEEQKLLQQLLSESSPLKTIYDFKLELQQVWHRTTATQMEMLERLQKWCQQAEATGIYALQDFVNQLKTYTLKQEPVRVRD